jgi:hypothetical protein
MDSPAAAALFEDLFKWYDRNKSGALEQQELQVGVVAGTISPQACLDQTACSHQDNKDHTTLLQLQPPCMHVHRPQQAC